MKKRKPIRTDSLEEKRSEAVVGLADSRKAHFAELLGEDCGYLDALTAAEYIHRTDVELLIEKGCPKELIPKILL